MPPTHSIEEEQDLCDLYLKRWKEVLYLGNWHIEVFVKPREVWTSKNDARILWDTDGKVAKLYMLYSADWDGTETALSWNNNLELLILHEISHLLVGEFLPKIPLTPQSRNDEEGLINKLSILFYELYHKDDPTKGDYDK